MIHNDDGGGGGVRIHQLLMLLLLPCGGGFPLLTRVEDFLLEGLKRERRDRVKLLFHIELLLLLLLLLLLNSRRF